MRKKAFLLLPCLLVAVSLAVGAQNPGQSAQTTKAPSFKSADEQTAYTNVYKLVSAPDSTPAQMDTAILDFVTKYPKSDFVAAINSFGVQFYQRHGDYAKMLTYGEEVLKIDPNNLYVNATLGSTIPGHVKDTDLDKDDRLKEAESCDDAAMKEAEKLGPGYNGNNSITEEQAQATRNGVDGGAHTSLAKIAEIRKEYATAVDEYQKSIPLLDKPHQAVNYYYEALDQEKLQKYDDASASLTQSATLGAGNDNLLKAVATEQTKVKSLQGSH